MRQRTNQRGEPMEGPCYGPDAKRVLARVRRHCRRHGAWLRPFRQMYGYESSIGPEWIAVVGSSGWTDCLVAVHHIFGEDEIAQAEKDTDLKIPAARHGAYFVCFAGSREFREAMGRK